MGVRDDNADSVTFRIVASAGYREGALPDDPELRAAATFATAGGARPAVYVTDGQHGPSRWLRFDTVVPRPATDGTPTLRFTASEGGVLPAAFRDVAANVHSVVLVDVVTGSGERGWTAVLSTA
ncbi:hypothetical protein [Amycolatopsis sp. SID8362]|uniref:hypothetical protein n=1 Tax=Amycolatopsis sp. SID8362 TaxID=2690346 RepID=UPI00136998B5|nr:hypothetical protein [Amycolatopsis sp. SID8362]NED47691.1 hypothetical protein [Amycolatopsis sp. SID8362]